MRTNHKRTWSNVFNPPHPDDPWAVRAVADEAATYAVFDRRDNSVIGFYSEFEALAIRDALNRYNPDGMDAP